MNDTRPQQLIYLDGWLFPGSDVLRVSDIREWSPDYTIQFRFDVVLRPQPDRILTWKGRKLNTTTFKVNPGQRDRALTEARLAREGLIYAAWGAAQTRELSEHTPLT